MAVPEITRLGYRDKVIESLCFRLVKISAGFILESKQHVNAMTFICQKDLLPINLIVGIIPRIIVRCLRQIHHSCTKGEGQAQPGRHHRQFRALCVDIEGADKLFCIVVSVHIIGILDLILAQSAGITCGFQGCALEPHTVPHIQGHGVGVPGNLHIKGNPDLVLPQPVRKPANLYGVTQIRKCNLVQLVGSGGRCYFL